MTRKTVGEWQRRLEHTFDADLGRAGPLWEVRRQEDDFAGRVLVELRGHVLLLDCFHAFFAKSLRLALAHQPRPGIVGPTYWGPVFLEFATAFRDLRAAELAFRGGYPLAGYRVLRDLKDRALFMAATAEGLTSWSALMGLDEVAQEEGADVAKERKRKAAIREEKRVLNLMIRKGSGLSGPTLKFLAAWEDLFHKEVHGGRLTSVAVFDPWVKGRRPFSAGPTFDELAGAAYTNRVTEVGWMWLRLLPYLQGAAGAFGDEWSHNWGVLDESFWYMEEDLRGIGKDAVVEAIKELIDSKFPFSTATSYVDRRPKGESSCG